MLGYEIKDADTYALWAVEVEIAIVRDALNATGRPIFFSLCGMYTNAFDVFLYRFLLKVVLVDGIH
jgi:hypothetical protein